MPPPDPRTPPAAAPPAPPAPGRPRVLVIAEACNPEWVSVPLEGWSHYRALRDVADVHLVTHPRNRAALLRAGLTEGDEFTTISHEAVAGPLFKLATLAGGRGGRGWTFRVAAYSLAYPYFERLLWQRFGPDLRAGRFDLVHQLTPLSPTTGIRTATRCRRAGVPFVWGPINGGVPWPAGFDATRRQEREWLSYVRSTHRLLPGYRAVRRDAAALVVGSRDTWRQMPERCRDRCVYVPENGVDPGRFARRRERRAEVPLRLVSLGRLVPYKGADMALEAALPLIQAGRATFTIYGDGPLKPKLEAMAEGVEGVTLAGWVDHERVQDVLAEADALVFPSIREFGGGAALEAMAVGLPAVVVDYAGPAELVTPETGWLVPLGRREAIVAGIRSTLEAMADDPAVIDAKGHAAAERVRTSFTWPTKARQTRGVYDWVLGRGPKPDYSMPL